MSKKVVRNRESYIKNWTAAIYGSVLFVSSGAAAQADDHQNFRDFRDSNPGFDRHTLRQMYRAEFGRGGAGGADNATNAATFNIMPVPNVPTTSNVTITESRGKWANRLERNNGVIKQSVQSNDSGKLVTLNGGVNLDLTSQTRNITLGQKLFNGVSSIEIQVGGETKTLTAGSKVTAAEYIAAKQVLAGAAQKVAINGSGVATGGEVDLSAITSRGDVMRASDLVVPVNVTTLGDFSKGSEFKLQGDLNNFGTVHALDGSGNGRGGTIRAVDINNNANALISSDVDLTLRADGQLTNLGNITSNGSLTLTSGSVTNRGTISSAKDVNLNSPIGAMNVDSTGGTISAANNINVDVNANSNLVGGDYLSQNLNLNAGAGTIATNLNNVTGKVNGTGYAVHFSSVSDTLNLGDLNLIDPTFYNIGNINFAGDINVNGNPLTVIASGNITESVVGTLTISTTGAGSAGDLTLIAGANITASSGPGNNTVGAGTPQSVTFNGGSIGGGSILLNDVNIVTTGTAGGNGGNVLLAAFGGTTGTSGRVNLGNGAPTVASTIDTAGDGAGLNGNVTVIAQRGINLVGGAGSFINTDGGSASAGSGEVRITSAQPATSGPVTYAADGSLVSGSLFASAVLTNQTVDVSDITASGLVRVASAGSVNVNDITTSGDFAHINLFAGVDPTTLTNLNNTAVLNINGALDATGNGSGVIMAASSNLNQADNADVIADSDIRFLVGNNYSALGFVASNSGSILGTVGGDYTVGNSSLDFVSASQNVTIAVTGDLTQQAQISGGNTPLNDGNVTLLIGGDYTATTSDANVLAGQGGAGYVGSVTIGAQNFVTTAGSSIEGQNVTLTSNSDNGGFFNLAGSVAATGTGTTGILTLNQTGTLLRDMADGSFSGGLSGEQMTFNNTTGGDITFLNNGASTYDFQNVTANTTGSGDITFVETILEGDGDINFTGSSIAGGAFTALVDRNLTTDIASIVGGASGELRSSNGNIGSSTNDFATDFGSLIVTALGGPSVSAGNVFISGENGLNFAGGNSQVTTDLTATALNGDITTDATSTVSVGGYAALSSLNGSIGTGLLTPFLIDVGSGPNQGVNASAMNDVYMFDASSAAIANPNSAISIAGGNFSFVVDGNLAVRNTVSAGTGDLILQANTVGGALTFAPSVIATSLIGDVNLAGNTITGDSSSVVAGTNLTVELSGTGVIYTDVDSISSVAGAGDLTINNVGGINIESQSVSDLTVNASQSVNGDVFVNQDMTVDTLTITNAGGSVFVNAQATSNIGTFIDTTGGAGSIAGTGALITPSAGLFSDTGNIDLDVNGTGGMMTVSAQAGMGGNVDLNYLGSNTLRLTGSTGNGDYTVTTNQATAIVEIFDDIDGTGALNITTNRLQFPNSNTVAFDSASVQSLAGSGLTLDGGAAINGATFVTTTGGAGASFVATDGDFTVLNQTNFVGGDVFVTLANNNGTNAVDLTAMGANLNGDAQLFPPGNNITIVAANIEGNVGTAITNFNQVTIVGNTIHNSAGDILLPSNLVFYGQNLALIASGNVTATGATLIDLSSASGNGGNLTILAGFSNSPATVGEETTADPVIITGFSPTGGSVDLTGVTINTNATGVTGNGGSVLIIANSGSVLGTGNVTTGDINASSLNGVGGSVSIGGSAGVTVGDINTTGGAAGGDVLLGVGIVSIVGSPTITNGVLSGGGFLPTALAAGNLVYGDVNAGSGDVALNGALTAGDTVNGGFITANNIEVNMGAGTVTLDVDADEVQADATFADGGTLSVDEAGSINVDHIDGNVNVNVNAFGTVNIIGNINAGTGDVEIGADTITNNGAKISADNLELNVISNATVNTAVNSLTSVLGTGFIVVNEDNGIALGSQAAGISLVVNASQAASGNVTTTDDFTVDSLTVHNAGGDINVSNDITGTSAVALDTTGGSGAITGTGSVSSPLIGLNSDAGGIDLTVDGLLGGNTSLNAAANGGNVNVDYAGTGVLTLANGSSGNVDFNVSAIDGSIVIRGDISGTGDATLTSDDISFSDNAAYSLTFDEITLNSVTDLTVSGGVFGGTFNSTTATNFNATNGDLTTNDQLNFNGGDVFATLLVNNGTNAFTNNGVLNGDGAFDGDPMANSLTITAALITPGTIQNFNNVNFLQGNTIINTTGDVNLPTNLTFQGQNLAIIASGNITATGAVLIDLSSATGNGGSLLVLAGYDATGVTGGQQQTQDPVTVTGVSSTGGNVSLGSVNIITSSTFSGGSAGDVTILAGSATGNTNAGNITVGNITAEGDANGGLVVVGAFNNVSVGNISTLGATGADGSVVLGSGTAQLVGTVIVTNGSLTSGTIAPGALSGGNVAFGTINAGDGDVDLAGALGAGNSIAGGAITADRIGFIIGSGTAAATGNFNLVSVDASASAGGSVTVTETDNINVGIVTGTQVNLTVNAGGDIAVNGAVSYGSGTLNLTGANVTQGIGGSITGSNLAITASADVTLVTNVTTLLDSSAANLNLFNTGNLTVNDITATGDVNLTNTGTLTFTGATTGVDVTVTNTGALTIGGITATGEILVTNTGNATVNGVLDATTGLTVDATGTLAVNAAVSSDLDVDLLADGNITVGANVTAVDGNLNIISSAGTITTADGITIQGDDSITIQTQGGGVITIGATNNIFTDATTKGTGIGNVTILQGATLPAKTKNLKGKNITAIVQDGGTVLTGRGKGTKKVIFNSPDNTLSGIGAQLLIVASTKNGVIIGGGATITADPPVAAGAAMTITTWSKSDSAPQAAAPATSTELPASLASITAPATVSSVNMMTTANATATNGKDALNGSLSNLATANNLNIFAGQEDDSTIVGYAPAGQVVDGKVCSDIEFGFAAGAGNGVSTIKHSDIVTLESGSALFVPSKDMTVVTPKGKVKLGANSVAFVNVDGNQLSVYDINDNHKGSVVVAAGGRELSLSPGRHLTVTNDRAASFAEANPIESIMHRAVSRHELGNGHRAFTTEFSIPSAVQIVKPLGAMMHSNHAAAKKVAQNVIKTSAVMMHIGGQAPYEFHTKPRTVAMNMN